MKQAFIPYGRHEIDEADIEAVAAVLRGSWITQGPIIERFEKRVAERCGAKHALAVANGTAALHVAAAALELGPGDLLWTSPNTFVASANCGRYCGADVDFVDIDPRTYNMSVPALERKLEEAARKGKLPTVIVPVHFAGQSCEMDRIGELARKYAIRVIEDAAHALGGSYKGKAIGNCQHSDMTTMSFHPVKIITTGEGGMVLTNRSDLYERLFLLRSHGITRDRRLMPNAKPGPWIYEQITLGWNYRLSDIHAAIGLSQMDKLDRFVGRRRALAKRYDELLTGLPIVKPWQHPDTDSSWHLYVIRLDLNRIKKSRGEVVDALRAEEIGVQIHYIPVHTQPYYQRLGFKAGQFPEAEQYYEETITLPLFPTLTDAEQERVAVAVRDALK